MLAAVAAGNGFRWVVTVREKPFLKESWNLTEQ